MMASDGASAFASCGHAAVWDWSCALAPLTGVQAGHRQHGPASGERIYLQAGQSQRLPQGATDAPAAPVIERNGNSCRDFRRAVSHRPGATEEGTDGANELTKTAALDAAPVKASERLGVVVHGSSIILLVGGRWSHSLLETNPVQPRNLPSTIVIFEK
jgi:hypothetical protein